ncbi:MAG TPA: type I-E CRISPR-associated protein Cas6/Cse3/CasE [Thermoflexia bacterium]|nr:type I-E CRISPR-associated protein Cas6/Cse3/CasE [Thermoflexia bacterium]
MYLSRLILNPRTRRVQRELANPYELHRTLMRAFPENLPAGERVLFRVDVAPRTGVPAVLLQSHTRPDWAWLGAPGARDYLIRSPATKEFNLTFTSGQTLAFRLRANPTVKHSAPGEKQGRRDPLYREADQRAWLERKGQIGGFRIIQVHIVGEGNLYGRQPLPKKGAPPEADKSSRPRFHKLTFHAVRFEGLLQVTNPEQLWQTVQTGIGSAKSFGFGLLSLGPVH